MCVYLLADKDDPLHLIVVRVQHRVVQNGLIFVHQVMCMLDCPPVLSAPYDMWYGLDIPNYSSTYRAVVVQVQQQWFPHVECHLALQIARQLTEPV